MAKLGSLLEKQFKKVGIEITDDLKKIIEIDTDVPDDIATKMDKGLLTVEAAKSNPDVIKVLRQNILGSADAKMDDLIAELGLQPGDDFLNEKSTYEKINKLTKLALDAGKKSSGAGSKQSADEFAKKEAEYNNQIKALKETLTAKESEFKTTRENDLTSFELKTILSGKEYIFPKEMDTNLKLNTALGAIQTELGKKGLSIKRNEAGQLVILNKEGQPAYSDTNEALQPDTFIDSALAQNKLLKINDPNQQQSSGSGGANTVASVGKNIGNTAVMAEIEAQLEQFK